jgi:hypothetical protein
MGLQELEGMTIKYMHCDCHVWPIYVFEPYSRCGWCDMRPASGMFESKEDCETALMRWRSERNL